MAAEKRGKYPCHTRTTVLHWLHIQRTNRNSPTHGPRKNFKWSALIFEIKVIYLCTNKYTAMGWTAGVRFPACARDFSLPHSVQTGSGANSASYLIDTGGSLPGDKAAGT
jgi:hypothetical protein